MKTLRLGTRRSALAQAQTQWVTEQLQKTFADVRVERVLITTSGDERDTAEPRTDGGLKALFTKEIDEALLDERVDLAVHSLKDLAGDLPAGVIIGAVPEREDPRDAWVSKNKTPFKKLAPGARVGTGAVRRQAQLKHARPDLELISIRGNVDTRLRKLADGDLDGIILALAGLKRLGRAVEATEHFAADILLPAVGQGCLAIECRKGDDEILSYLKALDHAASHQAALAERAFLKALGGSCQTPMAAYAELSGAELRMTGLVASLDGSVLLRDKENGPGKNAETVGDRLARKLLSAGAGKLLHL